MSETNVVLFNYPYMLKVVVGVNYTQLWALYVLCDVKAGV